MDTKITDKDLDVFVNEELEKDITQDETVDETVDQHLGEMGFLWDRVSEKLKKDGMCFKCKKDVDFSNEKINVIQASKTDKGVIAFVSICERCYLEIQRNKNR